MLFLREWYMHPNGQIPAYEFAFRRREPAGARLGLLARLQDDRAARRRATALFLERVFQKLLINFTWWVNRKDVEGNNLFAGGFLGLDNIGVFDRSQPLPDGRPSRAGRRHGVDGVLLRHHAVDGAGAGAATNPAYEDIASKFFEHFVAIADAMNTPRRHRACGTRRTASTTTSSTSTARNVPLRIRSMVGLIPLLRRRGPRAGRASTGCRASEAHGLVPREPPGPARSTSPTWRAAATTARRAPPAGDPVARAAGAGAALPARRERVPLALRHPLALARPPRPSLRASGRRARSYRVDYVPGESTTRPVRRQLQLARAGLVPGQLPADRGAGALPPLLRRRAAGRVPDRLGPHDEPRRGRARARPRGWRGIFLPDADGRRPCHGDDPRYADGPALARPACCSTSTSTATPAAASAPATRPAGPRW